MSGLRVTRLAVANVGVLRDYVDLGEFDSGITLIIGDNETGKTTTVQALRAALFERHGAGHADIRALQPYHTSRSPEVWVEFELQGRLYKLHKRFLKGATAELRIDDAEVYAGDEADEKVWECLGSRRPGTRGAKTQDMGLWGLLWVSQDEAAFSDPATRIGEETRGALQEAIGRQVGAIVGGRHGELVRSRVLEEARRFWTPIHYNPTGELQLARSTREAASDRVRTIEEAIADVEQQALRHESKRAQLDELLRERPALEKELKKAEEEAGGLVELQAAQEASTKATAMATVRLDAADGRVHSREEMNQQAEELEERVYRTENELQEMKGLSKTRIDNDRSAEAVREQHQQIVSDAQAAATQAEETLRAAQRAEKTRQLASRLAQARNKNEELKTLRGELADTIDEPAYGELKALDDQRRDHAAQLETEGTRLRVEGAGGEVFGTAYGRARTLEIPGVGPVQVTPAQTGLVGARDALRDAESAMDEALRSVSCASLGEARERRRERVELEVQADRLTGSIDKQAPEGVEALGAAAAKGREALDRDEIILASAEEFAGAIERREAELVSLPIDDDARARLDELDQERKVAEVRKQAIGTSLEVRALRDLDLKLEGNDEVQLSEGQSRKWTLTRPSRMTLGGVADLHIGPGGEDVQQAGARLQAIESELASALDDLGVETLDGAREQHRRWRDVHAALRDDRVALAEKAPGGLDVLRSRVKDGGAVQEKTAKRFEEARKLEVQNSYPSMRFELDADTLDREDLVAVRWDALLQVDPCMLMGLGR